MKPILAEVRNSTPTISRFQSPDWEWIIPTLPIRGLVTRLK